jgi:hypothetical protein
MMASRTSGGIPTFTLGVWFILLGLTAAYFLNRQQSIFEQKIDMGSLADMLNAGLASNKIRIS